MRLYYPLTCDSISPNTRYLLVNTLPPSKVSYILYAGPAGSLERQFDYHSQRNIIKNYDEQNAEDERHNVRNGFENECATVIIVYSQIYVCHCMYNIFLFPTNLYIFFGILDCLQFPIFCNCCL